MSATADASSPSTAGRAATSKSAARSSGGLAVVSSANQGLSAARSIRTGTRPTFSSSTMREASPALLCSQPSSASRQAVPMVG